MENGRYSIGLIGLGVVGSALYRWFEQNTKHKLKKYDPRLGYKESIYFCDFIFIQVPVPTKPDYSQDSSIIEDVLQLCQIRQIKVIRSTVLPGTADRLKCFSMPEFLTERTAYEDFCKLPIITGIPEEIPLSLLFPSKKIIRTSNHEAELIKYTHNAFGALKVNYFNHIFEYCRKNNLDYDVIRKNIQLTGFINDPHTMVPGPDGMFGFGGKCLPKDLDAFYGCTGIEIFRQTSEDNKKFRERTMR